jgi:photosystem II stability/assembly factor-like uncharacterized protein
MGQASVAVSDDGGKSWAIYCDALFRDGAPTDVSGIDPVSPTVAWSWLTDHTSPIARTKDGGRTWTFPPFPRSRPDVSGVSFSSVDAGWVWGHEFTDEIPQNSPCPTPTNTCSPYLSYPFLYKTSTGGASWNEVQLPKGMRSISAASFPTEEVGWIAEGVAGDSPNGRVYRTSDGGASWSLLSTPNPGYIPKIGTAGVSTAFITFSLGNGRLTVAVTHDSGATWVLGDRTSTTSIDVAVADPANAVAAVAGNGAIWRTSDGGNTWPDAVTGLAPGMNYIAINAGGYGVAVGGRVFVTNDLGVTWTTRELH